MFTQLHARFKEFAKTPSTGPELLTYLALRQTIGWLGFGLPFLLVIVSALVTQCYTIQPSISHYYYTQVRELFVGTLCAVSLFLFCYRGDRKKLDNIASNVAGFFCLGIALFPTDIALFSSEVPFDCQEPVRSLISWEKQWKIHFFCATAFFVILALMSIFLFTLSDKPKDQRTPQKRMRNIIYITCGIVMLVSLAVIGIFFLAGGTSTNRIVILFESITLWAFGISWLVKGEVALKDKSVEVKE